MSDSGNDTVRDELLEKKEAKKQNRYLAKIGLMVFATFACCILFFFMLFRFNGFASGWKMITQAAQPIIIGLVLAYLLNPVMTLCEKFFYKHLSKKMKKEEKAKRVSRLLGITGAILFLLIVIILLIAAIVPALVTSISRLVETLPGNMEDFINLIQSGKLGDFEVTDTIGNMLTKITDWVENWFSKTMLPQVQKYLLQVTTGVISMIKTIANFVIGIFVASYVLVIKEQLIGQSKKLVFAVFKPRQGNVIVELVSKADEIFGGFIIGKLIDSAIIGLICYIGCVIMRIPDSLLVAVIVGVTNIIPVFGPFIGAVPSLLLVVIQSPWHALYLLVFIILLQQVDGNIIGPKILGNSTGLSTFWVMFSILIGGGLFGFFGMLLGVPVFAMIYYIIRRLVNYGVSKKALPCKTEEYVEMSGVDMNTGKLRYEKKKKHATMKQEIHIKDKKKDNEKET